jgi:hypothetical protein
VATVASAVMLRAATTASASRVYSSTTFSNFSTRPSAVWSNWKSSAHTSFGRSARSLAAAVVESPRRRRLRRRSGTRSPSSRQSRWIRLRFTFHPRSRSVAHARR